LQINRSGALIASASAVGVASVYLLPPEWLGPLAAAAAIGALMLAVIVRVSTATESPSNTMTGILLSLANLPEQPLAKVAKGRALTLFLVLAAFLVSVALAVLVRANA
jgi:hypothetical protein